MEDMENLLEKVVWFEGEQIIIKSVFEKIDFPKSKLLPFF